MNRFSAQFLLSTILGARLMAGTSGIGVAVANGTFMLDSSKVTGNATIFEGNALETSGAASVLRLNSGVRIRLDTETRSRVYHDRALLERGSGTFELGRSFQVQAGALRISAAGESSARIGFRGIKTIQIAALLGSVQVKNLFGVVVANVPAGEAFEFTAPVADEEYVTKMTGRIRKEGARFFLEDETSKVQVELRGDAVTKHAGQRVAVSGTIRAGADGTPILQVSELTPVGSESKRVAAGGISHTAVIAGVVVAGAGAGAAVAIVHSSGSSGSPQPLSPSRP
ncbi:MAG TPA: OB-fold nucleic acid binding domain-containing protein [Bryobacteraceae bacterium]